MPWPDVQITWVHLEHRGAIPADPCRNSQFQIFVWDILLLVVHTYRNEIQSHQFGKGQNPGSRILKCEIALPKNSHELAPHVRMAAVCPYTKIKVYFDFCGDLLAAGGRKLEFLPIEIGSLQLVFKEYRDCSSFDLVN